MSAMLAPTTTAVSPIRHADRLSIVFIASSSRGRSATCYGRWAAVSKRLCGS